MKAVSSGIVVLASLVLAGVSAGSAALAAGGEGAASDGPTSTVDLTYTLYVGGISLGTVDLNARFQDGAYQAVSKLETSGVVNTIWRGKIEATSRGELSGSQVEPAVYDAFSLTGSNTQRKEMMLTFGGAVPTIKSEHKLVEIKDELKKATLDPVSAMVALVAGFDAGKPCTQKAPVYDGRRRYDVSMSYVKNQDVKMDNGVYAGPVSVCKLRYSPIAGAKQRILEGNNVPDVFAWTTGFSSTTDPQRRYVVPLRIYAETPFGLFVALVTRASIDGKALGKAAGGKPS
jgi:hypothetical protein